MGKCLMQAMLLFQNSSRLCGSDPGRNENHRPTPAHWFFFFFWGGGGGATRPTAAVVRSSYHHQRQHGCEHNPAQTGIWDGHRPCFFHGILPWCEGSSRSQLLAAAKRVGPIDIEELRKIRDGFHPPQAVLLHLTDAEAKGVEAAGDEIVVRAKLWIFGLSVSEVISPNLEPKRPRLAALEHDDAIWPRKR